MSGKGDGNKNPEGAKVLKLGLNISVSGDPGTDFEIVLDENGQKPVQKLQSSDLLALENSGSNVSIKEEDNQEVTYSTGAIPKQRKTTQNMNLSDSPRESEEDKQEDKDPSIIDKIKTTMEHFEKFSDHIKEIPRLRNRPVATSTPFTDKRNSKSESSLVYPEYKPRKYRYLYDYQPNKDYYKSSYKPPDLFLKPLPGESFYKRGMYTRYFDLEPYRHYSSDNSLNKAVENKIVCAKSKYDTDKYDGYNSPVDQPVGILKKSDSESGDKHSTSSADSIKDIKIYQSGGILIMQNFKDNLDANEKKEMSDFSAKLIENCNKLKEEISNFQMEKTFVENYFDENKNSGKTVQFDLTCVDGQKSRSGDSSATKDDSFPRMESSESTSDCPKTKDTSPQLTSQSQDFPSLSTQENDSIVSNQPGTSPTFVSPKKLEWDSGADIGYMNLDLMKENLSTIERIVLKGLSGDGLSEKNSEKLPEKSHPRSKSLLEKVPSNLVIEEIVDSTQLDNSSGPDSHKKQTEKDKHLHRVNENKKSGKVSEHGKTTPDEDKGDNINKSWKGISGSKTEKGELKEKRVYRSNKSVNVNTLWENYETPQKPSTETESLKQSETQSKIKNRRFSPKGKKLKKKRLQKPLKQIETPPSSTSMPDMGVAKKNDKNIKAIPVLNEMELSKEVEEIVIDQRYKTKEKIEKEDSKEATACETPVGDNTECKPEGKVKSRPISASSGSNKTVLPKTIDKKVGNKFTNQIIQTSELDCESIGIQAFASQVSSDYDFQTRERLNTSSKNIQAFGLNASLPKQLEHPKQSTESANQNTKSTQFFGEPVNSLPNYHSNVATKPEESCGRPKILKAKKNLEAEIIRLKEENEKNILANDSPKDSKTDFKKRSNNENKENVMKKKSTNSRKSQSDASRKNSRENETDSEKKESEEASSKAKKSFSGSECPHTSDEVSSLVLTSEVLKVYGESIDRNIIQEKYFQSQLAEFQKRKMVTRSTSMEEETKERGQRKEYLNTACQYSPQSVEAANEGSKNEENDCPEVHKKGTSEQYDSSQNIAEDCFETLKSTNRGQGLGGGDSLPSSTQTAHSWVPGMRNPGDNNNGVGRARSFEYLPGHIYESSGNLREELPSETEQNIITSCSSDSDTAKHSLSDRGRESEGRRTLVLENSTECSQDSDRLMTLDGNLTQLDFAVLKLREKDAQMQNVIRSLLASFWKRKGSGDYSFLDGGDVSKSEVMNRDLSNSGNERGDTFRDSEVKRKKTKKETEMSIACQTDDKSLSSDSGKFYEKKKELEKRISEEKKCQIKWIENEIYHLNILRELLEKQNTGKKRRSLITSNDASKSDETYVENISPNGRPLSVTPAYGCTISLTENAIFDEQSHSVDREKGASQWCQHSQEDPVQYGMAVSLSGKNNAKNWRRVVMLPVGVQVSLKDSNFEECDYKESGNDEEFHNKFSPKCSTPDDAELQRNRHKISQSDANTQYPSGRRNSGNLPSSSRQSGYSPIERCDRCREENCVCINIEKSYSSRSSRSKTSERRGSSKLTSLSEGPEMESKIESKSSSYDNYKKSKSKSCSDCKCQSEQTKQTAVQNSNCKCQNCFVQVSATNKADFSHVCPCQSNIYLNVDKSSGNFGNCCKNQSQKSSNSPCHIIKIHGAKCCSPGKGFCCCKNRSRRVENQSCQTDLPNIVQNESEERSRTKEVEMLSLDRCDSSQKRERSEGSSKQMSSTSVLHQMEQQSNCGCGKKSDKKKSIDDHPRHYFLKIEETEIDDDSNEIMEPQKPLEVITVKVPVKKAGKGKIYGRRIEVGNAGERNHSLKSVNYPGSECECCSECVIHGTKPGERFEPRLDNVYRRSVAEKPESPKRDFEPCERDANSNEISNRFGLVTYRSKELGEDYYPEEFDRNNDQSERCFREKRGNGSKNSHSCESCRGSNFSRNLHEIQSEYDSHKKSRNKDRNTNFHDRRKESEDARGGKSSRNLSSEWRNSRQGELQQNDFYNYNKREFMTRSELLKEEKQREKKMHNPSLKEYLSTNRPDFYSSAEKRRQIISERAKERVKRHNNRMDCLINLIHRCNEQEPTSNGESKRIFTTLQMREQTMKKYKKLPEVTGKLADEKKKREYKTNKLMADIFAKKLQSEALKGKCCVNDRGK